MSRACLMVLIEAKESPYPSFQILLLVARCSLLVANRQMIWKVQNKMHSPGIEPGTSAWKADILPLNYECFKAISINTATLWA
jgi:hypothetical protein